MKTYTMQEVKNIVENKINSGDYEVDEKGQMIISTGVFVWDEENNTDFKDTPSFADEQD